MSDLKFSLGLDNRDYITGMKAAQAEVRTLSSTARSANLGAISGELQLATGSLSEFTGKAQQGNLSLSGLWDQLRNGSGAISGVTSAISGATASLAVFAAVTKGSLALLADYAPYDSAVRGLMNVEGSATATKARLEELREVAKLPGLGFQEAVQGDIRLRSAGLSAEVSKASLIGFGNALASVGKGKADLDGVILALTQISAKGKITAEDINQIAERVPQIRQVMQNAFGTADTEALARSGMTAKAFIADLASELGNLPRVTGGAQNAVENFDDSWKALKTSAEEFGVSIASNWISDVSRGMNQARRLVDDLKQTMGIDTPAFKDAGQAKELDNTAAEEEAARAAEAQREVDYQNFQFAQRLEAERLAGKKAMAEKAAAVEKESAAKIKAAQEKVFAATLSEAENLQRQIAAAQAEGDSGAAAVNAMRDPATKALIAERTARIVELQTRLADLTARTADENERAAQAANDAGEAVVREAAAKASAQAGFQSELKILEAKAAGNDALASSLERQSKLEALKLSIMEKQGVTAEQAAALAARQITAEEAIAGRRERGSRASRLFSADETLQRRFNRLSDADKAKAGDFEGFKARNSTDRLGTAARQRAREAMDAAGKANPGGLIAREKGLATLEKTAREQLKATLETNARLADLGLAST
jgi:tape measure domain-containing protein